MIDGRYFVERVARGQQLLGLALTEQLVDELAPLRFAPRVEPFETELFALLV